MLETPLSMFWKHDDLRSEHLHIGRIACPRCVLMSESTTPHATTERQFSITMLWMVHQAPTFRPPSRTLILQVSPWSLTCDWSGGNARKRAPGLLLPVFGFHSDHVPEVSTDTVGSEQFGARVCAWRPALRLTCSALES